MLVAPERSPPPLDMSRPVRLRAPALHDVEHLPAKRIVPPGHGHARRCGERLVGDEPGRSQTWNVEVDVTQR